MVDDTILPKGENLRRAIQWISDHHAHTPEGIEQACRRFDLTPAEEDFLLRHFVDSPNRE